MSDEHPMDDLSIHELSNEGLSIDGLSIDGLEATAMLEAVEALERDEPAVSSRARPYLELLGSLPAGLEPVEPPAAVKVALMSELGTPTTDAAAGGGERQTERRLPPWALRLAAVLAVALLGISALQYSRIGQQQKRIEAQAAEIDRLQEELAEVLPALARPPEWMTASGTELCALSPRRAVEADGGAAEASKGWLFVRQDHQHWFVAVEGLTPPPPEHVYELWFLVEGELLSAGTFQPDSQGRATLTSKTMPNPVSGIAITLEPDNGDAVPSEEMVLYGDEVRLVL